MSSTPWVTFCLSTGRCGTQWLAAAMKEVYGDLVIVEHEPIGAEWNPKRYLRRPDLAQEMLATEPIRSHVARIEQILETRSYFEAGWTAFAAIPALRAQFGARLRILRLVRHPVPTALSLLTHNFHCPERRNSRFIRLAQLEPTDAGIHLKSYVGRWAEMNPFERCLYQWTEIHLWAEELCREHPEIPMLTLRTEEMFDPASDALARLRLFFGLPDRHPGLRGRVEARVDSYHRKTPIRADWRRINDHKVTGDLARRLGYDIEDVNPRTLLKRYRLSLFGVYAGRVRRKIHAVRARWKRREPHGPASQSP